MALNTGLALNVTRTALDKVFFQEFELARAMAKGLATAGDGAIFRQDTSDRGAVISEQYAGPGYFLSRAESAPLAEGTVRVGNQKTVLMTNFARKVEISKNLFDDDQHNTVQRMISDLGRLAQLSQQKDALAVYNLGFTTQLANDGVALFSNSHVRLGDAGTEDNLETGTLTPANLETSVNSLAKQRTQDGSLALHLPNCLQVPVELFKEAQEIAKSELRPGTANNDLNYFSQIYPEMQIKFSPFLSAREGGSDTAWFLLAVNHQIWRWVRQAIQTDLIDWRTSANNAYVYKAEYREQAASISYDGAVGSNGTV